MGSITISDVITLLEKTTLKTYYNSVYGYYFDCPPSWTIDEEDKREIVIFSGTPNSMTSYVAVGVVDENTLAAYKGVQGFIQARIISLRNLYYQFEVVKTDTDEVDYNYKPSKESTSYEVRHHFIQNGGRLYEIVCSTQVVEPQVIFNNQSPSSSNLYDCFDPDFSEIICLRAVAIPSMGRSFDSFSSRHLTSTLFFSSVRGLMVTRRGMPSRSPSLNLTPGDS